ncbi:hypothetical protein CYK37_00570 [Mesorhizobium loti]|nr:hypothetical protein [Mesorhizobium loti]PLP60842.1 hypothetical protein CYK37_00570 [Mesorhizobium loti]
MADTPDDNPSETDNQPNLEALEQQIASLRREINKLGRTIAALAEEETGIQVETVGGVVRNNPGTFSGALFLGATVGVVIGLALGQLNSDSPRLLDSYLPRSPFN